MHCAAEADQPVTVAFAGAHEHLIHQHVIHAPPIVRLAPQPAHRDWLAVRAAEQVGIRGGVLVEADLVVAEQVVRSEARPPANLEGDAEACGAGLE
jgi:hypothetical protein